MRPEHVNLRNFQVKYVLFDNDDFSIAYGIWEDGKKHLAMRWNGDTEDDPGYPKTFGNPVWFLVTEDLKILIIKSLINLSNTEKENILKTLREELVENEN